MNIDAGTMAPTEHGEVYVLNDGGETDLDLGNYERYLDVSLGKDNNLTTGKVYQHVIEREVSFTERRWLTLYQRRGDYLGKTVQIVPHLTNAVQDWVERVAKTPVDETGEEPDVCIVEVGLVVCTALTRSSAALSVTLSLPPSSRPCASSSSASAPRTLPSSTSL